MNTIERAQQLADERGLPLYKLSILCNVPYQTLRNTKSRKGQLNVDTIELICKGLRISLAEFFTVGGDEQ